MCAIKEFSLLSNTAFSDPLSEDRFVIRITTKPRTIGSEIMRVILFIIAPVSKIPIVRSAGPKIAEFHAVNDEISSVARKKFPPRCAQISKAF